MLLGARVKLVHTWVKLVHMRWHRQSGVQANTRRVALVDLLGCNGKRGSARVRADDQLQPCAAVWCTVWHTPGSRAPTSDDWNATSPLVAI